MSTNTLFCDKHRQHFAWSYILYNDVRVFLLMTIFILCADLTAQNRAKDCIAPFPFYWMLPALVRLRIGCKPPRFFDSF